MNWLLILGIAGMIISLALCQHSNPARWLESNRVLLMRYMNDKGNPWPVFILMVLIVAIINVIGW